MTLGTLFWLTETAEAETAEAVRIAPASRVAVSFLIIINEFLLYYENPALFVAGKGNGYGADGGAVFKVLGNAL